MRSTCFLGGFLAAALLAGATLANAEPAGIKPVKIAVTDLDCLNRDGRGMQRQNKKFFADLLVQALKSTPGVKLEHVDTPARAAVDDVRMKRYDLSIGGDYVELLDGSYSINVRLYDTHNGWVMGAWHALAPNWRQAFFEGKEEVDAPEVQSPALQALATQVSQEVYAIQLWRALRDLRGAAGLRAQIERTPDKERYPVHDNLTLSVKPSADAYVACVQLSSTGGACVLYPRPGQGYSISKQNEVTQVPGPGLRFRITDQTGSGEDRFLILLTRQPLQVDQGLLEPKDLAGRIKLLEAILNDLGSRPVDAWDQSTCVIKVSNK